jgi:hypothetical protein
MKRRIRTRRIRLDASTACQLRCPACPTASGRARRSGPALRFETAGSWTRALAQRDRLGWGEIFLNPHLPEIVPRVREGVRLLAQTART